jgi:hypothetical protein
MPLQSGDQQLLTSGEPAKLKGILKKCNSAQDLSLEGYVTSTSTARDPDTVAPLASIASNISSSSSESVDDGQMSKLSL